MVFIQRGCINTIFFVGVGKKKWAMPTFLPISQKNFDPVFHSIGYHFFRFFGFFRQNRH